MGGGGQTETLRLLPVSPWIKGLENTHFLPNLFFSSGPPNSGAFEAGNPTP